MDNAATMPTFWIFLGAVWNHAITLAAGCVVTVVLGLLEKYVWKRPLSWKAEVGVLLAFVVFACFQAWKDQYQLVKNLQQRQSSAPSVQVTMPPINVPPSQVVIERIIGSKENSTPLAFLQVGPIVPVRGQDVLSPGGSVALNINFEQKGLEPIDDIHSFERLDVVDMSIPNAEREVQKTFRKLQQQAHKATVSAGVKGDEVGIGQVVFNTAVSRAITQDEVAGILKGNVRLYIQAWASWKDSHSNSGTIDLCWWLQPPPSPELKSESMILHTCLVETKAKE